MRVVPCVVLIGYVAVCVCGCVCVAMALVCLWLCVCVCACVRVSVCVHLPAAAETRHALYEADSARPGVQERQPVSSAGASAHSAAHSSAHSSARSSAHSTSPRPHHSPPRCVPGPALTCPDNSCLCGRLGWCPTGVWPHEEHDHGSCGTDTRGGCEGGRSTPATGCDEGMARKQRRGRLRVRAGIAGELICCMLHVAMWGLQADIATVKRLLEHRQRCKTNGTLDKCLLCARSRCVRCVCCDCPPCGCLTRRLPMWRCVQPGVSAPSASPSPDPGNVRRRHGVSCVAVWLCSCVAV